MKKFFFLLIIFWINQNVLLAQAPPIPQATQNMLKYWYYRDRLENDFMLGVGNNPGENLPAEVRQRWGYHNMVWTDATCYLGQYIGVLAMEYRLLSYSNQPVDETLDDLYYALKTIERLDFNANLHYLNSGGYSGFLLRDDVGMGLYSGSSPIPSAYNPYLDHVNRGDITHPDIGFPNTTGDLAPGFISSLIKRMNGSDPSAAIDESQDQIIHIYAGVSLMMQYMNGVNTHLLNQTFAYTGGTSFYNEGKEIIRRLWDHVHPVPDHLPMTYKIRNPAGSVVSLGAYTFPYAYGFAKTYQRFTGNKNPDFAMWQYVLDPYWSIGAFAMFTTEWFYYPAAYIFSQSQGVMLLTLATTCHCAGANLPMLQYWSRIFEPMTWWHQGNIDLDHLPWLYRSLNGGNVSLVNAVTTKDILDNAPCHGPYNFGNYDFANPEWSTSSLIMHSDARGSNGPGWYYNGIDYMNLYNLYLLNNVAPNVMDMDLYHDVYIHTNFPYSGVGTQSNPYCLASYGTIYADNTIHSTADVTYRAGVNIINNLGFLAEAGSHYLAVVQPITCEADSITLRHFTDDTDNNMNNVNDVSQIAHNNSSEQTAIDIYSFPVPFSDNLNFRLVVPDAGEGELILYDLAGRQIKKVIINAVDKGEYFITIPAGDIGQGIYMCTLRCSGQTKSIRVTKTK